jgi:hypothetical protein
LGFGGTGYGQEDVKPQQAVTADLVQQVGHPALRGHGRRPRDDPGAVHVSTRGGKAEVLHMKVKIIRLACDNGGTLKLQHATLDRRRGKR